MIASRTWLILCAFGTVLPWLFFGSWIGTNGFDVLGFIQALFPNGAASGFSIDVLLSLFMFWAWSFFDAKANSLRLWWVLIPAGLTVGLSLVMPLYFYMRSKASEPIAGAT
jgi:hypothetical protein